MDLPRRPSSHPPQKPALDAARGTFREALAALRNLATLVRSRNVGPRAIKDMLPDVRAACGKVAGAGSEVLITIAPELQADAVLELRHFLADRCERLSSELELSEQGAMNARQRLHLEQVLEALLADLDGARALLALLESAAYEQTLPIDPLELLLQTYSGPPSGGHVRALLPARVTGDGRDVPVNKPRTLASLIACGVELVTDAGEGDGAGIPLIRIGSDDHGWSVSIELAAEPEGEQLTIWGYGAVPPTLVCLRAAAKKVGAEFTLQPASALLRLDGRR